MNRYHGFSGFRRIILFVCLTLFPAFASAQDLVINVSEPAGALIQGGTISVQVSVTNAGAANSAGAHRVTFYPPTYGYWAMQFVPAQSSPECALISGSETIHCNFSDIAAGATRLFTISFYLPINTNCGIEEEFTTTVQSITCPSCDPLPGNNDDLMYFNTTCITYPECDDGKDNDGDRTVDFPQDPGCTSKNDTSENSTRPQCADTSDNDVDGKIDFPGDSHCFSASDNSELPRQTSAVWSKLGSHALPRKMEFHAATVHAGKMWIVGGLGNEEYSPTRSVYYSDDGLTWTEAGNDAFPVPIAHHALLSFQNKLWVIGGYTNSVVNGTSLPALRKVYSSSDGITWTESGSDALPQPLMGHGAVVFNNQMWIAAGSKEGNATGPAQITRKVFRSSDGVTWTEADINALPDEVRNPNMFVFKDRMWIVGETDYTFSRSKVYSTSDGIRWNAEYFHLRYTSYMSPFDSGRLKQPQGIVLGDRLILLNGDYTVTGGYYSLDGTNWDRTTNSGVTSIPTPLPYKNAVTLLFNGKVFIFGGSFNGQVATREDEVFVGEINTAPPSVQCSDGVDNDADGLIDHPADPGCLSTNDNDESNPKAQCQDSIDNDGDGAIDFPADFSCSSSQDNDETNPKSQCQDGIDNDSDGLIDFTSDPGCTSKQDNDEFNTTQCSDGIDNDGDGAVDGSDYSCSNPNDNDETNPKAQCQDGIENDSDGLIDFPADPGCTSKQDNSEFNTTQCSDGIDNDGDGAIDGSDFSCTNPNDNDETNPKAQCQDGIDNDSDGLVDFPLDPGCTSKQDHDEFNTTQCSDGIDNDGDGAIDSSDFSCSNPNDNDETNPKAQCQDGIDNDSDGLVDFPSDPGCTSKQDHDEFNITQCSDGIDNDGDGATDSSDFSCSNPNDNDETNPKAHCQDGIDNDSDGLVDFPSDPGCTSKQDNDEFNTPQCSDGIDNDGDGAIDGADFSCSGSNDNDETNPKAQCQDGLDNDTDGLVDFPTDPGCTSNQDNSEFNTTQCSDGIDNDGDGAVDTADFSCSGPNDNDETNPKAQCQDGIDNDSDGLVDHPSDPGCSSKQDNDESNAPQCSDGIDNDGDGAVDTSDFSCSGPSDNDETNPKAHCQDGIDNDSDSLTDYPADPGCSSKQDNDEFNTTQCSDGIDNDGDGAIDISDFSCSGPNDNDETNPKSQCQDGIDNDSDGLIDFAADPGCSSKQDNDEFNTTQCTDGVDNDGDGAIDGADFSCTGPHDNDETNPKAQCQDGFDNDSDGAMDYPADFGCSSNQDNDESNPKAQCQDGTDNDSDGLIDFPADPGCSSNQDNDETNSATQCTDGIDNDGDGAVDSADFSCNGPNDNDETNPKAQCQDAFDNDGDGKIDFPVDPGCTSKQDNDESNTITECSDNLDNDADGLVDLNDPDCSGSEDPTEGPGPGSVIPTTECVFDNKNGTFTAYFGYENLSPQALVIPRSTGGVSATLGTNYFSPAPADRGQVQVFQSGRVKGAFSVTFNGDSFTWTVGAPGQLPLSATASRSTIPCLDIIPSLECIDVATGSYQATYSYQNLNEFDVTIPFGALNQFTPAPADRGQVNLFKAGNVKAAFRAPFSESEVLIWLLNGRSASASKTSPVCPGAEGCSFVSNIEIRSELDATALRLADNTKRVATILAKVGALQPRVVQDAVRAKRKADLFLVEANELALKFPDVMKVCPEAQELCAQVDNGPTIINLKSLYRRQFSAIKRISARALFRTTNKTRGQAIVTKSRVTFKSGQTALGKIARFATECE